MANLVECRQRRRANALRGRIRRDKVRTLRLQLSQFPHQAVIFGVGNLWRIHHMIQIFMMAKRGSQFCQLLFDWFHITPSMIKNPRQAGVTLKMSHLR
ncbi:Uncharacterised protein [Salmonella enterica subsp. enterica serovar Bovismorbificans]|uniref:Uncharacterized protein n=2 Tax=Salmonella enterica I TaxID=59201 RepID=A0A655DJC5_SALET|nr:Uncharacterised protein [Salmonella enterica subsp. enterica serovar Bovismorbificans]CNU68715.1 Uncharacterised protein [Salmonella enterica subsp. enterica serovar Bovismorbificans]